ncbi:hypothetical protein [Amycolatopsis sp. NPDC004625]|uniref:hypothetical protein n=1 Tax=Amycolatopsis sp. NPDC004625 TaxID=3154670 RepID=UPI0033BB5500
MTALGTAPGPAAVDAETMSMRRIIALTRGIRVGDVPDEVVADALRADRTPICWTCHEAHFSSVAPRCRVHGP